MHMTQSAAKGRSSGAKARARLLATAVFVSLATASQPFLTPAYAESFAFSNVVIEGNVRVDSATIIAYAGISRGQEVSAAALNDAYQRIVNSGLFESVEIDPQGSTLVIRVQEYPIVNVISFEGNKRVKDEDLVKMIQSQSRRVYSPSMAQSDASTIAEAYRVNSRLAATVTPKIIRRSENRVDLVFEITEGKVAEIERLSFVGNKDFSDRRLRQVLETKQASLLRNFIKKDTYVPERLELDKQVLTEFYRSRGYIDFEVLDASADFSRERDASFVTFTVREGLPHEIGNVTVVSEVEGVDAAEFEAVAKIKEGQTYSPVLIDNNITRMETLALKKGLNFIRVEPRLTRDERNQKVNIEFAIVRGERVFVERIDIEGNATTLDQVVRRQFNTVEGDPFNPREIRQSAERIRALGFFSDAQVDTQPGTDPDQVVVNVDVVEQPTGSLTLGMSYSNDTGAGLAVGFSESNFLGRGQNLSVDINAGSDTKNSSFSFTEPALLGRDLSFSVGGYYNIAEQANAVYNTRSAGFTTGIGFPLGDQSRADLRLRISDDRLTDYSGDSPILIAEAAQESLLTVSLGYSYKYDTRITGLNPKGGVMLRFGQDFAGLAGDTKYVQTTALALAETKIMNEEVTIRAIFEGGAITSFGDSTSRVTERYFGNGKIRGFASNGIGPRDLGATNDDALGGDMFVSARFEADFPVGLPEEYGITGGAFLDVGSVWSLQNTAGGLGDPINQPGGTVDDSFHPRASIGLSIFWTTPIGPLRFNFSKALQKEDYDNVQNFELTISSQF